MSSSLVIRLARRHSIRSLRLSPDLVNCGLIDLRFFETGVLSSRMFVEFSIVDTKNKTHPPPVQAEDGLHILKNGN
jgi:hypothetical protein